MSVSMGLSYVVDVDVDGRNFVDCFDPFQVRNQKQTQRGFATDRRSSSKIPRHNLKPHPGTERSPNNYHEKT